LGVIIFSLCPFFKYQLSKNCTTELLIMGSELPEHQNLCLVVICERMFYGEWMVGISFPMLLGVNQVWLAC
jgi:hypothetical protein